MTQVNIRAFAQYIALSPVGVALLDMARNQKCIVDGTSGEHERIARQWAELLLMYAGAVVGEETSDASYANAQAEPGGHQPIALSVGENQEPSTGTALARVSDLLVEGPGSEAGDPTAPSDTTSTEDALAAAQATIRRRRVEAGLDPDTGLPGWHACAARAEAWDALPASYRATLGRRWPARQDRQAEIAVNCDACGVVAGISCPRSDAPEAANTAPAYVPPWGEGIEARQFAESHLRRRQAVAPDGPNTRIRSLKTIVDNAAHGFGTLDPGPPPKVEP